MECGVGGGVVVGFVGGFVCCCVILGYLGYVKVRVCKEFD